MRLIDASGPPAKSPRGCSTRLATCCRDPRQDKAVEQFAAPGDAAPCTMPGCSPVRAGSARRASPCCRCERVLAEAAGPPVDRPASTFPTIIPIAGWSRPAAILISACSSGSRTRAAPAWPATSASTRCARLGELFAVTPALSDWRAVVIDSVDDLEPSAANALLKMLEEPPANCLFLLVSHVPGRLLPTIRSRCRRLTSSHWAMTP